MRSLQRLAALSVSAVIFAACSSGGSTVAPNLSSAASTTVKHAPNAVINLTFPTNTLHVAKSGSRTTKFIDPSFSYLEVAVTDQSGATTMTVQDYPVVATAGNTVPLALYLPVGADTVVIQEYTGPVYSGGGYLLAQGSTPTGGVTIADTGSNTVNLTMNMVVETTNNLALVSAPTGTVNQLGTFSSTLGSSYYSCLPGAGRSFYIVPLDFNGTSLYANGAGATANGGAGVPYPSITQESVSVATANTSAPFQQGTSKIVKDTFGGYTYTVDGAGDAVLITATMSPVYVDTIGYQSLTSKPITPILPTTLIEYVAIANLC